MNQIGNYRTAASVVGHVNANLHYCLPAVHVQFEILTAVFFGSECADTILRTSGTVCSVILRHIAGDLSLYVTVTLRQYNILHTGLGERE